MPYVFLLLCFALQFTVFLMNCPLVENNAATICCHFVCIPEIQLSIFIFLCFFPSMSQCLSDGGDQSSERKRGMSAAEKEVNRSAERIRDTRRDTPEGWGQPPRGWLGAEASLKGEVPGLMEDLLRRARAGWLLPWVTLPSDGPGQGYGQSTGLHTDVWTWTPLNPSSDPVPALVAVTGHLLSLYLRFPLNQVWLVFYKVSRTVKFIARKYLVRCQEELVFNGGRVTV